jgi:glycerol uptake facilitator-like aquaporin
MMGTAIFVANYMIHTDKSTRFSDDKSINSLIIASAYIGARLMCGGYFLTGIPQVHETSYIDDEGTIHDITESTFLRTGSLLNPAIAFGTQLISLDFTYAFQYILMPFVGGVIGFLSHEFIFMKTQEVFKTTVDLNED